MNKDQKKLMSKSRGVSFFDSVSVMLIPSKDEYIKADIHLWYKSDEIAGFRQKAAMRLLVKEVEGMKINIK